jgi:hypothetical protein
VIVLDELDVMTLGERVALWLGDETEWIAFVRSTYCVPCEGRGYYFVHRWWGPNRVEFPTCYHCGGEGRPRRQVAA